MSPNTFQTVYASTEAMLLWIHSKHAAKTRIPRIRHARDEAKLCTFVFKDPVNMSVLRQHAHLSKRALHYCRPIGLSLATGNQCGAFECREYFIMLQYTWGYAKYKKNYHHTSGPPASWQHHGDRLASWHRPPSA